MAMHDEGVNEAACGMSKRDGKATEHHEAETLPKLDGWRICADHEIELHGAEVVGLGVIKRMRAHGTGHASA